MIYYDNTSLRSQYNLPGHIYQNISDIMLQYCSQIFCHNIFSNKHFARISRRYSARKSRRHSARIPCWRTHHRGWWSGWNHRPLGLAQAIIPLNSRCLACLWHRWLATCVGSLCGARTEEQATEIKNLSSAEKLFTRTMSRALALKMDWNGS